MFPITESDILAELKLVCLQDGPSVADLVQEVLDSDGVWGDGGVHDLSAILGAFKDGMLYTLESVRASRHFWAESDSPDDRPCWGAPGSVGCDALLLLAREATSGWPNIDFHLPCYAVMECEDECVLHLLWVHPRARGKGLGRALLRELNITRIRDPLPSARSFYEKNGFEATDGKDLVKARPEIL